MDKNKYPALVATEKETEYKKSPPLKISSIGTEIKKKSNQMPDGSALLTDTGNNSSLKTQGIDFIIHAVPRPRSSCANDEEFIEIAVKAAQNSIFLADRERTIKRLAICFIAGKIYRGSCPPEKAAKAIIMGGLNQMEKCSNLQEIIFIAFDDKKGYYEPFSKDAFKEVEKDPDYSAKTSKAKVLTGDVCDKSLHGAEAIVNSENAEMIWGGGISGAISKELGTESSNVDQQRKDLMKEFNDLINEKDNQEENDTPKIKTEEQKKDNGSQTPPKQNQNGNGNEPNSPASDNENGNTDGQEPNKKNGEEGKNPKKNEKPDDWRTNLGKVDTSLGQSFNDAKVADWQQQKGPFNTPSGAKDLLESVKDNADFSTEIKSKHSVDDLKSLIANKSSKEVIMIIKRFEYDQLKPEEKENKNKKIRKFYDLKETNTLTDDQINDYLYKVATEEIDENSIKLDEKSEQIKPKENNILKIVGISALIIIGGGLLVVFIRKRKRRIK